MRRKGNRPPDGPGGKGPGGGGTGKNRPGRGRPVPKRLTPSEYGAMRGRLAKKRSFAKKAMHNFIAADPGLVEIFREIPKQVKLTAAGLKQVEGQLTLTAVEAEMFRQGLSANWGATRMSFFAETATGRAKITIDKTESGWKMNVIDQPVA